MRLPAGSSDWRHKCPLTDTAYGASRWDRPSSSLSGQPGRLQQELVGIHRVLGFKQVDQQLAAADHDMADCAQIALVGNVRAWPENRQVQATSLRAGGVLMGVLAPTICSANWEAVNYIFHDLL